MDVMQSLGTPAVAHMEGGIFVPTHLDQLETLGKYSVIYEIARIDALLSLTFVQDLTDRLVGASAS